MSDKQFVDTNVLVYSRDTTETEKHTIASDTIQRLWEDRTGVISTQVCNEYFVTVTSKLNPGLPEDEAWDDLEALFSWNPIPVDVGCVRIARHVHARYRLSWWDCLIVAACSIAGCSRLLSEDLNPQQEYLGIQVIDPFEVLSA